MDGFTPWPAELAAAYREAGYWTGQRLGDLFGELAAAHGDRPALVCGTTRVSYAGLARRIDRLAVGLLDLGIGPGQRVILQLPNIPEFLYLAGALLRIGALPVMALPAHRRREIGHLAEVSEATAHAVPAPAHGFDYLGLAREVAARSPALRHILIAGDASDSGGEGTVSLAELLSKPVDPGAAAARLDRLRPEPGGVALFLLSGGTTGLPKLIPRTHDDYAYNIRACMAPCRFGPDTVYMVCLPAAHNFPLGCPGLLGALLAGGRVVLAASPKPEVALPLIEAERVSVTAVVPAVAITWMDRLAAVGADISSLEALQVGGARLNPEAARRVRPVLGCALQQVFGMAEGLINFTHLGDPEDIAIHTQGRPVSPGDEIRVVGPDGAPVPEGAVGELITRGPYTPRGYYRADAHNRRAFTPDGFYRTGDLVRLHASGNLIVEGREKDLINRGGEKISAEEIENLILAHPAVANVAAVAMPDPLLGERVCVYVQLHSGQNLTLDALRDFLEAIGIAPFKMPERLETLAALPLTAIGKVDKKKLRADIAGKLDPTTGLE